MATCYWNGKVDSNWNTTGNWWTNGNYNVALPTGIPQNGDSVDLASYYNAVSTGPTTPVSIAAAYMGDAGPMAGNWTFGANLTCGPLSITSPSGTISITVNGTLGNITSAGGGAPTLTLAIAAGAVCGTVPSPFQSVSLGNNCTVGAIGNSTFMVPISSCGTGVTFTGSVYCGGSVSIGTGATFANGITVHTDGSDGTIGANWKIGNGAAGGSITFEIANASSETLTINNFASGQSPIFSSLVFNVGGGSTLDISALSVVTITSAFTLSLVGGNQIVTPSGNPWLTLGGSAAKFNYGSLGVGIGHVPSVANVVSTDNVFGTAGTFADTNPGAANVKKGIAYTTNGQSYTGTMSSGGGQVVIV